jgi:cytochrome c biogenesis protein CcmG, thiol:disulfide interchange protein DsbE
MQKVVAMEVEKKPSEGALPDERHVRQLTGGQKRNARRRRFIIVFAVSIINVALLALLGSQLLIPAQDQSHSADSSLEGHPAPDFTLATLNVHAAPKIELASLKGKPVMLNFWASWCDPCKHEAPLLETTWLRVQGQGIVFLGIDFQDTASGGLSFLRTYGITYPNVVDAAGSVAINYGVTGVPETYFLDRRGVVVQKVIGELTEQTLQSNLQALLHST